LVNGGGVEISHREEVSSGGAIYKNDYDSQKFTIEPHPDLIKAVKELKPFLCRVFDYTDDDKSISVTGLSLSNDFVSLTGKKDSRFGGTMGISAHKIDLNGEVTGWEDDLEVQVNLIEEEVYLYRFEDKKAQLEIAFEE